MPEDTQTNDLGAQIVAVIADAQRIPVGAISLDSTFQELKIDSLDGINLVFALEEKFGITIPDDGVHNMRSVRDVVNGVRALVQESNQTAPPGAA